MKNASESKEKKRKFRCPCCGYFTLEARGEYDICPVCFWEDDKVQCEDEALAGGANRVSLVKAKENYARCGACEEHLVQYVREPLKEEMEGEDENTEAE